MNNVNRDWKTDFLNFLFGFLSSDESDRWCCLTSSYLLPSLILNIDIIGTTWLGWNSSVKFPTQENKMKILVNEISWSRTQGFIIWLNKNLYLFWPKSRGNVSLLLLTTALRVRVLKKDDHLFFE